MGGFGRGLESLMRGFQVMLAICAVFIPLGVWKLVDIVLWLAEHVSIN